MDPREGRVRHQVTSFGSRLKDTFTDVFENPAIFAFGSQACFFLLKQFLGLILRELSTLFCGVGRRLNSSPLSHTWNLQELKDSVKRTGPITQRDVWAGATFARSCA